MATKTLPGTGEIMIGSRTLSERLSVNRSTIVRWRMAGYLPKPIRNGVGGSFWLTSAIEAWEAAGRPWCDLTLAKAALARAGSVEAFNESMAPRCDEVKSEAALKLLDRLEDVVNDCELFVQVEEALDALETLGDRFQGLREDIWEARRRLNGEG